MIDLIPIKVECHSGYKADDYPKCFYLDDNRYEIIEISDRWYQGDRDPGRPVCSYFKVYTASGEKYIIKHDIERDEWYLINRR